MSVRPPFHPVSLAPTVRRSRSAHDLALQAIGMAIVTGRYPIGSLLPSKEELMGWLKVSHTTLREALQTLAAKGMVAAKAKVGTRVLAESHWNMFDAEILAWRLEVGIGPAFLGGLFEIRQCLEPVAAALAAERRSEAEVAQLRALATHLTFASNDRAAFVDADVAFHQCVLNASRNPFMQSLSGLIGTALAASFTLSAPTEHPQLSMRVQRQHLDIADAIADRDPQRASDAMMRVISQAWTNYAGLGASPLAALQAATFHPPRP